MSYTDLNYSVDVGEGDKFFLLKVFFLRDVLMKPNFKVSFSSPVPEAEPCFGFLFSLLAGVFRGLSFGGYGGQLGPGFQGGHSE